MNIRTLALIIISFGSFLTYGQFEDVQLSMDGDWHQLKAEQGIVIEYKFEVCEQVDRQVAKYILKIENTNSVQKEVRFATELHQNGDCVNCHRIDREEYQSIFMLQPGAFIQGVCGENNRELEFFSHFIVMVPGMSAKHLTNLVITNIEVE